MFTNAWFDCTVYARTLLACVNVSPTSQRALGSCISFDSRTVCCLAAVPVTGSCTSGARACSLLYKHETLIAVDSIILPARCNQGFVYGLARIHRRGRAVIRCHSWLQALEAFLPSAEAFCALVRLHAADTQRYAACQMLRLGGSAMVS